MKTKVRLNNLFLVLSGMCLLTVTTVASASTCPVLTSMDAPSGYTASDSNASCTLTGSMTFTFSEVGIPSTSGPMTCVYTAENTSGACALAYYSDTSEATATASDGTNYWNSESLTEQLCTSTNPSDCTFTEDDYSATTCPIFTSSNYTAGDVTSFTGFYYTGEPCASAELPVLQSAAMQGATPSPISCGYMVPSDGTNGSCGIGYMSGAATMSVSDNLVTLSDVTTADVTPTGSYWITNGSVCYESAADCVATP